MVMGIQARNTSEVTFAGVDTLDHINLALRAILIFLCLLSLFLLTMFMLKNYSSKSNLFHKIYAL